MGLANHVADVAAIYDRDKYAWMPSRDELEARRAALGLPAIAAAHV